MPPTRPQQPQPARSRTSCAACQLPWLAHAEMAALATSTVRHSGASQARQKAASASGRRPEALYPEMAAVAQRWSSGSPVLARASSTRCSVRTSRRRLASLSTADQGATSGCSSCR